MEIDFNEVLRASEARGRMNEQSESENIEEQPEEEKNDVNESEFYEDETNPHIETLESLENEKIVLSDIIDPSTLIDFQDIFLSRVLGAGARMFYNSEILTEDMKLDASEKRTLSKVGSKFFSKVEVTLSPTWIYLIAMLILYATKLSAHKYTAGTIKKNKSRSAPEIIETFKKAEKKQDQNDNIIPELNADLTAEKMSKAQKGGILRKIRLTGSKADTRKRTIKTEAGSITADTKHLFEKALSWGYKIS
tara:strand:+ start:2988 stop:3737 length:750 start_codon:yes stop_codon:yes gene_type:complete